jgi:hypothetical protein
MFTQATSEASTNARAIRAAVSASGQVLKMT